MNEFVDMSILSTLAGCALAITLLTQVFKRYLPDKIDTKWLALIFSVIVGVARMIYVGQYDFAGVLNIAVLLSSAIGLYEIGSPALKEINKKVKEQSYEKKDNPR